MGNKSIPMPAIIAVAVLLVAILGFVGYKVFGSHDDDPMAGLTQQQKIEKIKSETAKMKPRENGGGVAVAGALDLSGQAREMQSG